MKCKCLETYFSKAHVVGMTQPMIVMGLMWRPKGLFVNLVLTRGAGANCHLPVLLYILLTQRSRGSGFGALGTCSHWRSLPLYYLTKSLPNRHHPTKRVGMVLEHPHGR